MASSCSRIEVVRSQFNGNAVIAQANNTEYNKWQMRRNSLTPAQAQILADLFRARRQLLGRSMRSIADAAHCNVATVSELEAAVNHGPQPDTLKDIAEALGLPVTDVFVAIGWLPPNQLPAIAPYLRSKYSGLTDQDIAEIGALTERLRLRNGTTGPQPGEDELP